MFFLNLPPLVFALFLFCIDFLAIIVIRITIEKKFYLSRWWTFKYGDSIFLPFYGFFAAIIMEGASLPVFGFFLAIIIQSTHTKSLWYTNIWWNIMLLLIGYAIMFSTEYLHVKHKIYTVKQQLAPSQLYHSFIFGIMFFVVASTLPVIFLNPQPTWATVGALLALFGFLLTSVKDIIFETVHKKK